MTRGEMREMGIRTTPGSLEEAIAALEQDHEFLTRGEVFTEDLIQTWITYKREKELDPLRLRPHPYEFYLYYDALSRLWWCSSECRVLPGTRAV
jgi:glutamine synthetase